MKKLGEHELSMTIEEYAEALLPIINLCLKEKAKNPKAYKKSHLWYIYRQAFYGFAEFIDWESRCKVSAAASSLYKEHDFTGDLRSRKWYEQPDFDTGRQKGKFHLEHVFTGDMFRDEVESIPVDQRTAQRLVDMVRQNYCVAWILKEENRRLPKSARGRSLHEALQRYKDAGIELC